MHRVGALQMPVSSPHTVLCLPYLHSNPGCFCLQVDSIRFTHSTIFISQELPGLFELGCSWKMASHSAAPLLVLAKAWGGRNTYSKGKIKFKKLLYLIKTEAYLGQVFLQKHFQGTQFFYCCCLFCFVFHVCSTRD